MIMTKDELIKYHNRQFLQFKVTLVQSYLLEDVLRSFRQNFRIYDFNLSWRGDVWEVKQSEYKG